VSDAIAVLTDRKSLLSEDSLLERVIAAAEERQLSIHSSPPLRCSWIRQTRVWTHIWDDALPILLPRKKLNQSLLCSWLSFH
jgi:hypothetical protein